MMRKLSVRLLMLCLSVVTLSACDGIDGLTRFNDAKFTKDAQERIKSDITGMQTSKDIRRQDDVFSATDDVWVGNQTMRLTRGKPLPRNFDGPNGITLSLAKAVDLPTIAGRITEVTKIPVRVDETTTAGSGAADSLDIAYEGSLSGLLDQIAAHFGLSWAYDGNSVTLFRYETRTFTVEALPGSLQLNDEFKGDDSSSSGSSGATDALKQENNNTIDIGYWEELNSALDTLVGEEGEVAISEAVGTVTVSTTPQRMRKVAAFMNGQNQRLSKQVSVNVEVFSVTLTDSDSLRFGFRHRFPGWCRSNRHLWFEL